MFGLLVISMVVVPVDISVRVQFDENRVRSP